MARTKKAALPQQDPAEASELTSIETLPPAESVVSAGALPEISQQDPPPSAPAIDASPSHEEATPDPSKPPGRAWSERFIQPVKYSRSNFKHPEKGHLIAFRFDLPAGETKPSDELLAVLRNHKVFRQGRPVGLMEGAGHDPQAASTGLHYEDFGPGLGKLWVMPNGELGRTVADSLDMALNSLAKKMERGATRQG